MRKLKVLNITEEGRGGGALYRIMDVAHELRDEVDTLVLHPQSSPQLQEKLESREIHGKAISLTSLSKQPIRLLLYALSWLPDVWRITRVIKNERPHIVYANGSWQMKGIVAAKWCGVPSVWHMNDMYQPRPVRWAYKLVARYASAIVYASERTRQYYEAIHSPASCQKTAIISAPVDVNRFTPDGDKVNLSDGYKVLSVGYINANKGYEYLIKAAAHIKRNHPERKVAIYIIGPVLDSQEEYKRTLDDSILEHELDNIHFIGYQSNTAEWIRSVDAYVCSSVVESSPIAVWEALACGQYVISTDVGDVRTIFHDSECGKVVPVQDPAALGEAIINSITDKERDKLQHNARKAAISEMSLATIAQRHYTLYQNVAEV